MIEKVTVNNYLLGKTLDKVRNNFIQPFMAKMDEDATRRHWVDNLMNNFENPNEEETIKQEKN